MRHYQAHGLKTLGMKPIATGCESKPNGLRNADAEQLLKQSGLNIPYHLINPYAFAPPIAPHLAAAAVGEAIQIDNILKAYHALRQQTDKLIIEGVGGWRVPINERESLKDLVLALDLPVVLVVGLRLGCINHALLTAECIVHDGCRLLGWIANSLDADFPADTSVDAIAARLSAPLWGKIPFNKTAARLADDP